MEDISDILKQDLEERNVKFEELAVEAENRLEESSSFFSYVDMENIEDFTSSSRNFTCNLDITSKSMKNFVKSTGKLFSQFSKDATIEFEQVNLKDETLLNIKNQYIDLISKDLRRSWAKDLRPIQNMSKEMGTLSHTINSSTAKLRDLNNLARNAKSRRISYYQFKSKSKLLKEQMNSDIDKIKLTTSKIEDIPEFDTLNLDILEDKESKIIAEFNIYCKSKI